jgi:hypothetical protein
MNIKINHKIVLRTSECNLNPQIFPLSIYQSWNPKENFPYKHFPEYSQALLLLRLRIFQDDILKSRSLLKINELLHYPEIAHQTTQQPLDKQKEEYDSIFSLLNNHPNEFKEGLRKETLRICFKFCLGENFYQSVSIAILTGIFPIPPKSSDIPIVMIPDPGKFNSSYMIPTSYTSSEQIILLTLPSVVIPRRMTITSLKRWVDAHERELDHINETLPANLTVGEKLKRENAEIATMALPLIESKTG